MKFVKILFVLASIIICYTASFSQVKNCDISYLDSNHVRQNYFKVQLESLRSDSLTFTKSGKIYKISLLDLKRLGYLADSKSPKGMLIGAGIGAGIGITFGILSVNSGGGHPDFSITFGEAVGATLILAVIGGVIGGAIGGISNKQEYVNVDFTEMNLNKARETVKNIFENYGIEK